MKNLNYRVVLLLALLIFSAFSVLAQAAVKTDVELVSRTSDGTPSNNLSSVGSISDDGRYVAFFSRSTDLVANDNNGVQDVFLLDRQATSPGSEMKRISLNTSGGDADKASYVPIISADGRYIVFVSNATNLDTVEASTENDGDIFLYDANDESITRITLDTNGQETDGDSRSPAMSRNGRFIAFRSDATDLIANDTNGVADVFLYDMNTGTIELASVPPQGITFGGGESDASTGTVGELTVSDEGDVLFSGTPSDDPNFNGHIYLRDRSAGTTTRIDRTPAGNYPNGSTSNATISADGAYIAFESTATDIVTGISDTNDYEDIFLYEVATGTTTLITRSVNGASTGTGGSYNPGLSSDGRYLVFSSESTDLVTGSVPYYYHVYLYDRVLNELNPVSLNPAGEFPTNGTDFPYMSSTGEFIIAESNYTGYIDVDDNGWQDIFLFTMALETNVTVSDVTKAEGTGGTTDFTFTATSDNNVAGGFTIDFATSDGTATAGEDYTALSGTLTFAGTKGETQTFTVSVAGDSDVESDENFTVTLSNPSRVNINGDTATGTITNDDSAVVTVEDVTVSEGDTGTTNMTFTATVDNAMGSSFTVDYATSNGTAIAGEDYTAKSGTLTFAGTAGETQTFTVPIAGDTDVESNETFTVTLSSPSNSNVTASDTATGTIMNDDVASEQPQPFEALTDGGFEGEKSGGVPVDWNGKDTKIFRKDKQKCNKDKDSDGTIDKFVANSGNCAFMFKGNPTGERTKLNQKFSDLSVFTDGAILNFSVYVDKRSSKVGHPIGKLIVKYVNGDKEKVILRIPDADGYTLVSGESITIDLSTSSLDVVKVSFRNRLTSGKFFIDDASLTVTPATTLRTERDLLPLPEVPNGFRD